MCPEGVGGGRENDVTMEMVHVPYWNGIPGMQ